MSLIILNKVFFSSILQIHWPLFRCRKCSAFMWCWNIFFSDLHVYFPSISLICLFPYGASTYWCSWYYDENRSQSFELKTPKCSILKYIHLFSIKIKACFWVFLSPLKWIIESRHWSALVPVPPSILRTLNQNVCPPLL